MTRLSTTLNQTAAAFRADAAAELAAGNPESYETLTRLADSLERIATNQSAHAILTGDPSFNPVQIDSAQPITPERFRAGRLSLGMTQVECAAALGVDPMTVSRWERGIRRIPGHAMLALDALAAQQ